MAPGSVPGRQNTPSTRHSLLSMEWRFLRREHTATRPEVVNPFNGDNPKAATSRIGNGRVGALENALAVEGIGGGKHEEFLATLDNLLDVNDADFDEILDSIEPADPVQEEGDGERLLTRLGITNPDDFDEVKSEIEKDHGGMSTYRSLDQPVGIGDVKSSKSTRLIPDRRFLNPFDRFARHGRRARKIREDLAKQGEVNPWLEPNEDQWKQGSQTERITPVPPISPRQLEAMAGQKRHHTANTVGGRSMLSSKEASAPKGAEKGEPADRGVVPISHMERELMEADDELGKFDDETDVRALQNSLGEETYQGIKKRADSPLIIWRPSNRIKMATDVPAELLPVAPEKQKRPSALPHRVTTDRSRRESHIGDSIPETDGDVNITQEESFMRKTFKARVELPTADKFPSSTFVKCFPHVPKKPSKYGAWYMPRDLWNKLDLDDPSRGEQNKEILKQNALKLGNRVTDDIEKLDTALEALQEKQVQMDQQLQQQYAARMYKEYHLEKNYPIPHYLGRVEAEKKEVKKKGRRGGGVAAASGETEREPAIERTTS